jgi:hypothetical protein
MFAVQPQIRREAIQAFDVKSLVAGEQADYSVTLHTVEIPLAAGAHIESPAVLCSKVKPGEIVLLTPKVSALVKNRIVHVEVHADLYRYGRPSFKRLWRHGETLATPVVWECFEPYQLTKLPFLYEIYIVNQHIRGPRR